MPEAPPALPVADTAPDAEVLTRYDEQHLVTYLRILDADAEGADWTEVASVVLHVPVLRAAFAGVSETETIHRPSAL